MDKKFKFNEQSPKAKLLYAVVIGILTVTAIVIAIVSAASKPAEEPDGTENPPITEGGEGNGEGEKNEKPEATTYSAPLEGEVMKGYSEDLPVFSVTLGDFRVHTGVDIAAEIGDAVVAAARGVVTRVYHDPFFGQTVEVTHEGGVVTRYSNLDKNVPVKEGDNVKSGDKVGQVGDTSLTELADEAHLHFEITVNGNGVDPIDFIEKN